MSVSLILCGLQSPINIGSVLRVAETFAIEVAIWDEAGVFDDPEKRRWIEDFSCGAYRRHAYRLVDKPPARDASGRNIATCIADDAVALTDFVFQSGDRVAIGNEYRGLPDDLVADADVRLRIPMAQVSTPKPVSHRPIDAASAPWHETNGVPVLSAAMAAGIVAYTAFIQSRARPMGEDCR